jgi:hypothetical protein
VPLRGAPGRLILAVVPWVTSRFPSILLGYNMKSLSELDYLVLYTKLSSCLCAHMSGRAGSKDRSVGLLVGQARLSGMAETLVSGDPWVPMSVKPPIDEWAKRPRRGHVEAKRHYMKTSNRSRSICNGPLMPVTSTHICNGCCLVPVTYKRARTTMGLASTTPVTNVDFW